MAFQPTSTRQELANRKILEELQLKKQILIKQGAASTLTSQLTPSLPVSGTTPSFVSYGHKRGPLVSPAAPMSAEPYMTPAQRTALQQSYGFFVTQDSLYGNSILPVLPRFDTK